MTNLSIDSTLPQYLTCDHCGEIINDPLKNGALTWELVVRDSTVLNTQFRITHKLTYCIRNKTIDGSIIQWRYLSDFVVDGEVNFDVILAARYDDFGYRIDLDAEFDDTSINNVYFRMCAALERPKPIKLQLSSVELMEDFSPGQFYILDPEYLFDTDTLMRYFNAAKDALENHHNEMSEWGQGVAQRLFLEIPTVINRNQSRPKPTSKTRKPTTPRAGYVYLIQSTSGAYKIGRTVNPDNRLATFSVKLPFEVEYVCVIQCDDMYYLERQLHAHFADKRVNGEWFNLSPDDVDYIKGMVK